MKDISCGVPQGSVLGPLLFNLFINDINNIENTNITLFADDAVFCVLDLFFDACVQKLRVILGEISKWLSENRLVANTQITKIMLLTTRPFPNLPQIVFYGVGSIK